jgi:hypothetical protein
VSRAFDRNRLVDVGEPDNRKAVLRLTSIGRWRAGDESGFSHSLSLAFGLSISISADTFLNCQQGRS